MSIIYHVIYINMHKYKPHYINLHRKHYQTRLYSPVLECRTKFKASSTFTYYSAILLNLNK